MVPLDLVLWEVDTQADFMLPGGKLYVPGAEKLLPNIAKLTAAAHNKHVFLVSHGCFHSPDDPEFQTFPPHCVKGTQGSEFVTEALTDDLTRVPNKTQEFPNDVLQHKQVLLEKETLDIFESSHADKLVSHFPKHAEFLIFGVVTEYCVRLAAKGLLERGRKVSIITDAIETLNPAEGRKTLAELEAMGAKLTTTNEVLSRIHHRAA
ncbi:MAG TPA: cysteine hydrolase family protein [Terriglobales bacterium]|nr:cysteine hydrolase family protein [Terriglobales bacterium]